MTDLFEVPSWASGFIIVAILSGAIALSTARLRHVIARWSAVMFIPALLAYGLYWGPVPRSADTSEYSIWAPVCIIPWSIIGILTSIAVMIAVRQHMKTRRTTKKNEAHSD